MTLGQSLVTGARQTFSVSTQIVRLVRGMFSGRVSTREIGGPIAIGIALFLTEVAPRRLRKSVIYLIDEGVPSSHIEARGYGESRPKATNNTPEGRQLNRRVEIHIRATQS